jgi:hypothetical protein
LYIHALNEAHHGLPSGAPTNLFIASIFGDLFLPLVSLIPKSPLATFITLSLIGTAKSGLDGSTGLIGGFGDGLGVGDGNGVGVGDGAIGI